MSSANTNTNFIDLDGERFELLDEIDTIPLADSFVKKNKLRSTRGHGEAKLYVGALHKKNFDGFFSRFAGRALFLKKDLLDYLQDAKFEYEHKEQKYRKNISESWEKYYQIVRAIAERNYFTISRQVPQDRARYYIKSNDKIFELFRSLVLPIISYVSILKLKDQDGKLVFLFRPALSYSYNPYYHPAKEREVKTEIESKNISSREKERLVMARVGQGDYRKDLLEESSECIITKVNDERILIASHLKPWSVSNDDEKIDHRNGLTLTPTYDKLLNEGFISFENDGTILLSPYISPLNLKKLNLTNRRKYTIPPSDERNLYLAYHRQHIFKK